MLQILGEGFRAYLPEKKLQSLVLLLLLLLQYTVEHVWPAVRKNNQLLHEGRNLLMGIFNLAVLFIPSALLVQLLRWLNDNHWGLLPMINLPDGINIVLTILLMDFIMYWWHRANHRWQVLWLFHRFHHLDPMMTTSTALRFHTVELLLSLLMKAVVYTIFGFSYGAILVYETLFFAVVLFHHSNIGISKKADALYRKIFSSPLMHRIHHSTRPAETDSNYGSVFSCWDYLFNSYTKEPAGEIVFGVDVEKG